MKKALAIIGLSVAVGAAAYTIWGRHLKKDNATTDTDNEKERAVTTPESEVTVSTPIINNNINTVKHAVINSMTERHEEAAKIMKDAVDIIYQRSEVSEDEMKELEQISSELDNLLNEE